MTSQICFSEKIGQFIIADKNRLTGRIEKSNTLYNTTTQGLFDACIEKFTAGDPTAWRQFKKVSLSKRKKKNAKNGDLEKILKLAKK